MAPEAQARLWQPLLCRLFSCSAPGSGGRALLDIRVSLGFVVVDVVWACRPFYRFQVFLGLCESLRI